MNSEQILLPVLDLVGSLHVIDVHTDLVVDVRREVGAVAASDVRKHDPGPKLLVVQQTHGLVDQTLFIGHWLQFVQIHTLK